VDTHKKAMSEEEKWCRDFSSEELHDQIALARRRIQAMEKKLAKMGGNTSTEMMPPSAFEKQKPSDRDEGRVSEGDGNGAEDSNGKSGDAARPQRKSGVRHRRGRQEKGGRRAADCYEESLWDPKVVMPALGIRPVGHVETCFPRRNGCPRQGSVCPESRARLDLMFGSNAHHATAGLEDFSHVWLLFLFDANGTNYTPRPSVCPPRLNGKSKGVFATRSPHRPCPIGLSLVRLDAVQGRSLLLSGVDLVDGTPILDVKPYIPCYDVPYANGPDGTHDGGADLSERLGAEGKELRYPEWCVPPARAIICVEISPEAEQQLRRYEAEGVALRALPDWAAVRTALTQVLQADPRSVYRKESCAGQRYPFYLDCLDISASFDDKANTASVIDVAVVSRDAQRDVKAGTVTRTAPASQSALDLAAQ